MRFADDRWHRRGNFRRESRQELRIILRLWQFSVVALADDFRQSGDVRVWLRNVENLARECRLIPGFALYDIEERVPFLSAAFFTSASAGSPVDMSAPPASSAGRAASEPWLSQPIGNSYVKPNNLFA
jgi:hypothetical protein